MCCLTRTCFKVIQYYEVLSPYTQYIKIRYLKLLFQLIHPRPFLYRFYAIFKIVVKHFSLSISCTSDAGLPYIGVNDYVVKYNSRLGGGHFGAVYRGHYKVAIAVKVIKTTHSVEVFKSEINIAG